MADNLPGARICQAIEHSFRLPYSHNDTSIPQFTDLLRQRGLVNVENVLQLTDSPRTLHQDAQYGKSNRIGHRF